MNITEITNLIAKCKYSNCSHQSETECAIKRAINDGTISTRRFESYLKQLGELQRLNFKIKNLEVQINKRNKRNKRLGL